MYPRVGFSFELKIPSRATPTVQEVRKDIKRKP
jgi:hypothetical protein